MVLRKPLGLIFASVMVITASAGEQTAWGVPQTFNTALPVAQGEFIFREQFVLVQSGRDPGGMDREFTASMFVSVLGYGVTPDLAFFAAIPYMDKRLDLTPGGERRSRRASGPGDAMLFGRYTLFKKDWAGRTLRVAPFIGVEAPTGEDDKSDARGRLPAVVQPGSGSWDMFGGVVASYQTFDFLVDAQTSYRSNTEANGFEFGDEARLDVSFDYRLWPGELGGGVPGFLYGALEANVIYQDKNRIGGSDDPNSNGTTIFLMPGLQYVTRRWIVETGVQLPVVQNLNGTALEKDFIFRLGIRAAF